MGGLTRVPGSSHIQKLNDDAEEESDAKKEEEYSDDNFEETKKGDMM